MELKKSSTRFFLLMIISILSLIVIHCAVPPGQIIRKDGKLYGKKKKQWKVQWLKYYQRGYSYSQEEYWDYAARDLQEAIKMRPLDQRWIQPYGWHIQDEYFPHRELGIIYYHQKRYEKAMVELEISLSQAESAKAMYFLNLAREAYLKETGVDRFPPNIDIEFPQPGPGLITGLTSLTILGEVTDDQYVQSIHIKDTEIPIELSSRKIDFQEELKLGRGENRIIIEAIDLVGRKTQKEIVLWCDWRAPIINIDSIVEAPESRMYVIEGYISDFSGVAGFWLNGIRVELASYGEGVFSVRLPVSNLKDPVKFNAVDLLGNRTSGKIDMSEIIGQINAENPRQPKIAFCGQNPERVLASLNSEPDESKKQSYSRPVIRLKEIPDRLSVDWEECFLEGEIKDFEGLKSLIINGISLINRTGKIIFFNFKMPLEVGENEITIQAESLSGEVVTKKLSVERKLNKVQKIGSRLKLAIIPFKYIGERREIKDLLYDALIQNFIQRERFQIVEREKIKPVSDPMKTEDEDNDSKTFIELGRAITADGIVVGSAYFENDYLEIIARVIDTETTVILDSEEVFGPIESLQDIQLLAEGLSIKFKQAFPLLEGRITNMDDASIQIDLGKKDLILPFMKVIFFREEKPLRLPGSETVLEKRFVILGEGRIKTLYESYADVAVLSLNDDFQINIEDLVITK